MKIGFPARVLEIQSGGTKEYFRHLIKTLLQIDKKNTYYIYYNHQRFLGTFAGKNLIEKVVPHAPRFFWDHLLLPLAMKRDGIDVAVFLNNVIPLVHPFHTVVSMLDMAYFMPELNAYRYGDTKYMNVAIPISARSADAILAISQNTKADILRLFKRVDADKITVTYLAPAYTSVGQDVKKSVAKKYKLEQTKYIFLSSSLSPRKNIRRALAALAEVKDQIPHKFVLTGGKTWSESNIWEYVDSLGIRDRFMMLGFVPDEDLPGIYANADLYLHPSLYEGFSMTILEAFAAGCPVVASNVSSHPEVVGDAGILFDPYDIKTMAQAVLKVANDEKLKKELVEKGYKQLANFSWEKTAQQTLQVIEKVAQK